MKLALSIATVAAALGPAVASAQPTAGLAVEPPALVAGRDAVFVDQPDVVPFTPGVATPPPARILYLNDCKPHGCTITTGPRDDSRRDVSSIPRHAGLLTPYAGTAEAWDAIVRCVRANYAPFTIAVTTVDPGDVPHFEAFTAGMPADLGYAGPVGGVASISCGVIPNAVSFTFLNLAPEDVEDGCWTISQETAHNFGLGHSMLATDVMTYLPFPSHKAFVDQSACIGTQGCCQPHRECQCGQVEQNSHERLLQIFGAAGATGPDIVIDEPVATTTVLPGFAVRATVTDWDGVAGVELIVDARAVGVATEPPFAFTAPTDLVPGAHTVTLRATDPGGARSEVSVVIAVDAPCTSDGSCAVAGPDRTCVEGRCVVGSADSGGCASSGPSTSPALVVVLAALAAGCGPRRRRARA